MNRRRALKEAATEKQSGEDLGGRDGSAVISSGSEAEDGSTVAPSAADSSTLTSSSTGAPLGASSTASPKKKAKPKARDGFPCWQDLFVRPTTYHHGDARSIYNPVRLDEYDQDDGDTAQIAGSSRTRRSSNTSNPDLEDTMSAEVPESGSSGGESAIPRLGGSIAVFTPDTRRRVRSLRQGATDNMYHYRTPSGGEVTADSDGTGARDNQEGHRALQRGRTTSTSGSAALLVPPGGTNGLSRVPSSHRDAANAPAPVPILQNRSSVTGDRQQPSPVPSTASQAASPANQAQARSGVPDGRGMSERLRPMQPIRTDTATLQSSGAAGGADGRVNDRTRTGHSQGGAQAGVRSSGVSTPTAPTPTAAAPPSFPQHAQTQSIPPPSSTQPPTPSVSQPTHQIGHWQTYGPGVAPPPYTEQPVFHYPFGRNRQGDGAAGGSSGASGGASGSRGLTWARDPIVRSRNRAGANRSGRNSRASSTERDSGDGEDDDDHGGAASGQVSTEGSSAALATSTAAAESSGSAQGTQGQSGEGESTQQREQRIERKRKKGLMEPLGLPSPFAKASKDRVPDFKSGLREGAIGAWAEVREGLKGPIGLPWYWAKEGGVLGLVGGVSYGVTVLALCPISASIVFLNHSSRGAIRSTRTAHQNRQLSRSKAQSQGRSRSASMSNLPRTGSIDNRSLRRRESILSRTTSRASISPTERVSMTMTGDELRRAVSIHGTGQDTDEDEDDVSAAGPGEGSTGRADGEGEAGPSSDLARATSRGSRWRMSRRRAKSKRTEPIEGDGVEEGTPTNSTVQSGSSRSAATQSMVSGTGIPEGSPRVGTAPAERRLTELEREAKWGNFGDGQSTSRNGPGGSVHAPDAVGGMSAVERETKLRLFPELNSPSSPSSSTVGVRGDAKPLSSSPRTTLSPREGSHRSHRHSPSGVSQAEIDAGADATPRLELDTKWPLSDSPLALSPELQMRERERQYTAEAQALHQRQSSTGGPGSAEGRVSGLEMDTKWQLPSDYSYVPPQSAHHGHARTASGPQSATEEKAALLRAERDAAIRAFDEGRVAAAADRTASDGPSSPVGNRYRARDRMPSLGLMIDSSAPLTRGQAGEDLPVVQAIDAGVSFRSPTGRPQPQQAQLTAHALPPRPEQGRVPESGGRAPPRLDAIDTMDATQQRTSMATAPPPLMTPTAYELDIKWPLDEQSSVAAPPAQPRGGIGAEHVQRGTTQPSRIPSDQPSQDVDVRAEGVSSHGAVQATPEPSPPDQVIRTPETESAHLRDAPSDGATRELPRHALQSPYAPLAKTDTITSTLPRDSDYSGSGMDVETSTFAETDLDSSFSPSQAHSFAQSLDYGHSPYHSSNGTGRKLLSHGQGSLSPISTMSPISPLTPFDQERQFRQTFKREGYGFNSGVTMGGEGGRRLSL